MPSVKKPLVNNATAINPATPAAIAAIEKARGRTALQNAAPAKKKKLIPALAASVVVVVAVAGYIFYDQDQAAQEQQRVAQIEKQQEQKLLEEKQQLASKLAAEKAEKEKAEQLKAEKLKAEQLAVQNKNSEQTQAQASRLAKQEKATAEQQKAAAEQAEKLAAVERQKAEAARQEKLKAEQEQARGALQKKINDLFASAESNIQKTRLKAAYRDFQAILKLEPGNDKAESGITRVADRYLALARTAAQASDFDKADSFVSSVIQIAPTHDRLGSSQQEVLALKDAQLAKQAAAQRAYEKQLTDLFASAESQLLNTRLEAAYQSFQKILALEPGNGRAESGIDRVADRYLALARTSALANDFDQASKHIGSAIQIAPMHDKLSSTQQEIFDLKDAQLAKQAEAQRAQQEAAPEEAEPKKRRTFGAF